MPDPVGATTRAWWPLLIASQAPSWAGVGALKLPRNHAAVAGEKRSRTSPDMWLTASHPVGTVRRSTVP